MWILLHLKWFPIIQVPTQYNHFLQLSLLTAISFDSYHFWQLSDFITFHNYDFWQLSLLIAISYYYFDSWVVTAISFARAITFQKSLFHTISWQLSFLPATTFGSYISFYSYHLFDSWVYLFCYKLSCFETINSHNYDFWQLSRSVELSLLTAIIFGSSLFTAITFYTILTVDSYCIYLSCSYLFWQFHF